MFSTPPWEDRTVDVRDSSTVRRFKSFTRRVLKKVDRYVSFGFFSIYVISKLEVFLLG
jgi:hypothetical protein